MLRLPNVSLFGIDCLNPLRLMEAMSHSCDHVRFAEVVVLTDLKRHPNTPKELNRTGVPIPVRLVHHVQSDRKVDCPRAEHYKLPIDYEMASLREPSLHVRTSHLLFHEWDSAVLNPLAWSPEWLRLDIIGAPWPAHLEEGWIECDGETNAVGNFGFSLRSKRFCELTRLATETFKGDEAMISSDMWACRTIRPWLESKGIRFATVPAAMRFSCENRVYGGEFGFHGRWTCELNNWGGWLAKIRPIKP